MLPLATLNYTRPVMMKQLFLFFSDTKDMLWDAICRGSMWVKLGLVQSLILSPVGPVDPVEKNSIELQHVNEAVTALVIVIFIIALETYTIWLQVFQMKKFYVEFFCFSECNSDCYAFSAHLRTTVRICQMLISFHYGK